MVEKTTSIVTSIDVDAAKAQLAADRFVYFFTSTTLSTIYRGRNPASSLKEAVFRDWTSHFARKSKRIAATDRNPGEMPFSITEYNIANLLNIAVWVKFLLLTLPKTILHYPGDLFIAVLFGIYDLKEDRSNLGTVGLVVGTILAIPVMLFKIAIEAVFIIPRLIADFVAANLHALTSVVELAVGFFKESSTPDIDKVFPSASNNRLSFASIFSLGFIAYAGAKVGEFSANVLSALFYSGAPPLSFEPVDNTTVPTNVDSNQLQTENEQTPEEITIKEEIEEEPNNPTPQTQPEIIEKKKEVSVATVEVLKPNSFSLIEDTDARTNVTTQFRWIEINRLAKKLALVDKNYLLQEKPNDDFLRKLINQLVSSEGKLPDGEKSVSTMKFLFNDIAKKDIEKKITESADPKETLKQLASQYPTLFSDGSPEKLSELKDKAFKQLDQVAINLEASVKIKKNEKTSTETKVVIKDVKETLEQNKPKTEKIEVVEEKQAPSPRGQNK